jgi:hypothetical protein
MPPSTAVHWAAPAGKTCDRHKHGLKSILFEDAPGLEGNPQPALTLIVPRRPGYCTSEIREMLVLSIYRAQGISRTPNPEELGFVSPRREPSGFQFWIASDIL